MGSPVAFQLGQQIGQSFSRARRESRDENAIESILSQAMSSGDPAVLQNSIGKILSQVSPERQGVAVQYLQGAIQNIESKKTQASQREALTKAGVDPNLPPELQKAQYEEMANQNRFSNILGNSQGVAPPLFPSQTAPTTSISPVQQMPISANASIGTGAQQATPLQKEASIPNTQQPQPQGGLRALSDDQLIALTGVKGYSEPAKQELRRRQEEKKASQSNFEPESEKLEAKRVAELATEIENEYNAAKNEDLRLDRQIKLDEKGNVSTPTLIKVLDTLGLPIGILSNPDTEEYRKLEADFVRDVSKVFPGGKITNYELQSYLKTIPGLLNSPEGRRSIIRNRKLMNEAKRARYDEYKKIIKENNGKKPPNLSLLLDERMQEKIADIEDRFINGIESDIERFQQPIRMIDPKGNPVDIPPNMIERALKAGAKFS